MRRLPVGRRLAAAGRRSTPRASTSTISIGSATAAYLTGHDEEGFARWVRAHQVCLADGARAPGGVLRGRSSPRASASRATSAAAEAGSTAPPGSWTRRTSTASSRATSSTGSAMLRLFEAGDIAGRARPLRPGRQDRRPLRPPRARHARADRRGPHADLPGRHRRRAGAARRGHGRRSKPASCHPSRPATRTAR